MPDSIQQNRPQQTGSGFTNLSQYLNANQNNQLGSTVAGGIQQAGQAATGAVNQAGQQFQQGVQSEQNRQNQLGQNAQATLGNLGNIQQKDIDTYQSALSGQSRGPKGLANSQDLQNQAQQAQQLGQATGSEAGRYGLLQRYVGRGQQYGLGNQTLDSAILGQTGQNQLRQARASTNGLGQSTNQAISAANAQGQQLQNQAGQVAQQAQQNLGNAITGYDTGMQQKLADQKTQYQNILNQLGPAANNSAINLDPAALKQLSDLSGGVLNAGTKLYNVDLSPYLSVNQNFATKQGVQSADDQAKAQALSKLAGNSLAGTDAATTLQAYLADPTQVGQFAANPFSVSSQSDLANALKGAEGQYASQVNPLQQSNTAAQNTGIGGGTSIDQIGSNQLSYLIGQGGGPYQGQNFTQQQLQDALNRNLAQQASNNQKISDISNQFDTFRVLQAQQPPTSGVVMGNGGQPLTADQLNG